MNKLYKAIIENGSVEDGNIIRVDSFLNHQIDVEVLDYVGQELFKRFEGVKVDKILTIESSGIAIAVIAARYFKVPVVFGKKTESKNLDKDTYSEEIYSFTKDIYYNVKVSKKYLSQGENILIVDDFMAGGNASLGLIAMVEAAGAKLAGVGIVIEKGFQAGGDILRRKGIKLESLAIIDGKNEEGIIFRPN